MLRALLLPGLLLLALPGPLHGVEPDEILADPAMEARARDLGRELRCLVCQNQSIEDSDAPLARDLRVILRRRIEAGDSDEAAVAWIVERYGDYVLLKPPLRGDTAMLWGAPLVALAAGALVVAFALRRNRHAGKGDGP
ncbi:MAG: cytochrome c-type biogenesis protein CcmH [Alphaproteobacteria bacterium]|nr:cytochrome c-type biogenesis protein CcmH [Alphaproteobacteria bacterium]